MTASLINTADIAALKARRTQTVRLAPKAAQPAADWQLSRRQIATLKPGDVIRAHSNALELLVNVVDNARSAEDGREIAAPILMTALNLLGYAGERYAGVGLVATRAQIEAAVREHANNALSLMWDTMSQAIAEAAAQQIDQDRDQITTGVDAAQAEASQARRELERARAAWASEKAELEGQVKALQGDLGKLRYDTDKASRRMAADLADVPRLQALVGEQDRQLLALRQEKQTLLASFLEREAELLADLDALTRPPEAPMSLSTPVTALERASYCNHVRTALGTPAHSQATAPLTPELVTSWRQAYPDEAAMLRQLRHVLKVA